MCPAGYKCDRFVSFLGTAWKTSFVYTPVLLMFFSIPGEHGSRCKQPRDVRAPSTLQHKKAEALGRFEATVEAFGAVWDWSAAWILCTDLHDKGRIVSSHPKHHWKCTHSEYCSVRDRHFTILPHDGDWTNHLLITFTWSQSYFFSTIGVSWWDWH